MDLKGEMHELLRIAEKTVLQQFSLLITVNELTTIHQVQGLLHNIIVGDESLEVEEND